MERKSAWSLPMSEQEIVNEYKAAKKPQSQIAILADQNGCEKKTIVNILELNGCELPGNYKKKKKVQPLEELGLHYARKAAAEVFDTIAEETQKLQTEPVPETITLAAAYIKAAAYDAIVDHPALWEDGEAKEFIATVSGIRALVKKLIKEA